MYGHVRTLALEVKKGLEAVGCKATLLRVAETLPDEVLAKMGAPGIGKDDEVATAASLATYDALMFGFGTRFGMAPAQVKALMDSTGGLWQKGAVRAPAAASNTWCPRGDKPGPAPSHSCAVVLISRCVLAAAAHWQAGGPLRLHRHPEWRAGDDRPHLPHAAHPPRHGICADGLLNAAALR